MIMKTQNTLKELLSKQVVLGDGAMGTMLYESGIFLNTCFDELNLVNSELVRRVHKEYVQAGVDFIEKMKHFKIPIVAGIWPFTSYKNAEFMANEVPGVVVPENLLKRMSKAKTREDGRALGIEIAREMIEQISDHVDGFAVSAPFGNVRIALAADIMALLKQLEADCCDIIKFREVYSTFEGQPI
jgi:hypothetical protein